MKRWLINSQFAKGGNKKGPEAGYTITELLIVLAATTGLISITIIAFSGRQAKVEFAQSVRAYESMLENIMSDVIRGYYRSDGYECIATPTGLEVKDASSDTGTNKDCQFTGKVITTSGVSTKVHTWVQFNELMRRPGVASADPIIVTAVDETIPHKTQLDVVRVVGATPDPSTGDYKQVHSLMFLQDGFGATSSNLFTGNSILIAGNDSSVLEDSDPTLKYTKYIASGYTHIIDPNGYVVCLKGGSNEIASVSFGRSGSSSDITALIDIKPALGDACYGI